MSTTNRHAFEMTTSKLQKLRLIRLEKPKAVFEEALRRYEMAVADFIDEFITLNNEEKFDELHSETFEDGNLVQEAPYYQQLEGMIDTFIQNHLKSKGQ